MMNKLSFRNYTKHLIIYTLLILASLTLAQNTSYLDINYLDIDYSIQPSLGDDTAPVKVVFFEDFTCPHCANFEKNTFPKLKEEFLDSGDVEFFLINMQFLGPDSTLAGVAGECAYDQNEALFWTYKTILLASQKTVTYTPKNLAMLAEDISGLSVPRLHICILGSNHEERIEQDLEIGRTLGVRSTPSIFVNDQKISNNYEAIRDAIRAELITTTASSN